MLPCFGDSYGHGFIWGRPVDNFIYYLHWGFPGYDLVYILIFTRVSSTNSIKDSEDSNIYALIHIPSSISHANRRQ